VKLSEFCYPALTTVHIPRDRIGHIIFERLALKADRSEAPVEHEIVIDPEFVLRDSTGPAA
jgi:DNA-binding LacI/PurR family transcriptional regulator